MNELLGINGWSDCESITIFLHIEQDSKYFLSLISL